MVTEWYCEVCWCNYWTDPSFRIEILGNHEGKNDGTKLWLCVCKNCMLEIVEECEWKSEIAISIRKNLRGE